MKDQSQILCEGQVINSSTAYTYSNVYDTQGSSNVTTLTPSYGFGAGKPKYVVITVPTAFTTVTSVQVLLQTADATTTDATYGTILSSPTTLWDSTAIAIANLATAGMLFPGAPIIVPVKGCKQYLQVKIVTVGYSTSEVGAITAYLDEQVAALQVPAYGVSPVAY